MQKRFNKYEKFKILRKLMKENTDGILDKNSIRKYTSDPLFNTTSDEEYYDVIKTSDNDEKDIPGIINSRDPAIKAAYTKIMDKFQPSQLIFDNKDI